MSAQQGADLDCLTGIVGRCDQPHLLDKLEIHFDHG
jgi:hypothetical protein